MRSPSNENKMSDGGRDCASLEVKVWKSCQKRSVRRSAVRSIVWLGLLGCRSLLKMLSKQGSVMISFLFLRCRWRAGIDSQDVIVSKTGMNVNMKMRNLLKRCLADGVPKTHALVGKYCADRAGDTHHGRHKRSPRRIIQFAHVLEVARRNDQCVTAVKLSKIDECNGQLVLMHDARGNLAGGNVAEDAAIIACAHRPNENKMSDGGRDRESLGVEVWKSSQKWSVQRSAVRSIAWLGGANHLES